MRGTVKTAKEYVGKEGGGLKSQFLNIITMSWPDWFGVSMFKAVDWEMSKRRKEMTAHKRSREQYLNQGEKWRKMQPKAKEMLMRKPLHSSFKCGAGLSLHVMAKMAEDPVVMLMLQLHKQ